MAYRPLQNRRSQALAAGAGAALLVGVAVGATTSGDDEGRAQAGTGTASTTSTARRPAPKPKATELPGGGRRLFPDKRVVAYYGNPRDDELGALGIGTPDQAARRLKAAAKPFARKTRPVLPAMELISTVATAAPGPSGLYRDRVPSSMIRRYLKAARKAKALLILDVQPGRGSFTSEVDHLARWLREPDVGLALDPEWHVGPDELPGKVIGSVDGRQVDAVGAYLADVVKRRNLPDKLLLVHRFTDDMIVDAAAMTQHRGVRLVVNTDGFGTPPAKVGKYRAFARSLPRLDTGFKLFYKEDTNMMSPKSVLALQPPPDVVVYE